MIILTAPDQTQIKLFIEILESMIKLKEKSSSNVGLTQRIDAIQAKIVDEIAHKLDV